MRSYILLFVVVFTVAEVKSDLMADLVELDQTCRAEASLTKEDFGELFDMNIKPSVKCYIKCLMNQFGIWNNGIDVKAFMTKMKKVPLLSFISGPVKKILDQCQDVQGEDDCEKAFNVVICLGATIYKDHGAMLGKAYKLARG